MKLEWLLPTADDLRFERQQLRDEGRDISPVADEFVTTIKAIDPDGTGPVPVEDRVDVVASVAATDAAVTNRETVNDLLDRAQDLPVRDDYQYREPSGLDEIRRLQPESNGSGHSLPSEQVLMDRIHGAWLGRCAGCLLGKPVEGWTREKIEAVLRRGDEFPLEGYVPASLAGSESDRFEVDTAGVFRSALEPDDSGMPEDDDLNYTVAGMDIVNSHGLEFDSGDVARYWLRNIPILRTHTAERVAYRNIANLVPPPDSATHRNPYREWIGATIRADPYGYAALGRPSLASELAWRDARISHIKNGVYAPMWVATMLAAAPTTSDPETLLRTGLEAVPEPSRLTESVEEIIQWRADGIKYEAAIDRLHDEWDQSYYHHWCHSLSNAQIVSVGLLWGDGRFGKSICRTVQAGFDTDSNGATVGSIVGMLVGREAISERWVEPLGDTIETGIDGYHRTAISDLAETTVGLVTN